MGWDDIINDDSIKLDMSNLKIEDLEAKLQGLDDAEVDLLVTELRKTVAEANSRKAVINNILGVVRIATKLLI